MTGGGLQALAPRYGAAVPVGPRLGQGTFRLAVTPANSRSCTVTGKHEVSNRLLLRSYIHRLFNSGYVGVTPDYKFVVSDRLRGDYSNRRSYYSLHGQPIALPARREDWPSAEALAWHGGAL